MSTTGTAAFWLYPNPNDATVYELDLGQCLTDYQERPDNLVADTTDLVGGVQRVVVRRGKRLSIELSRIRTTSTRDRKSLARQLQALQSHLNRGGRVSFSANRDKAWARIFSVPKQRGDTTWPTTTDNPWPQTMTGSLSAGDWIRLQGREPFSGEEMVQVASYTDNTLTGLQLEAPGVLFDRSSSTLASWEYCWPVLMRPEDGINTNIVTNVVGRLWTMQLELVVDVPGTWGAELRGAVSQNVIDPVQTGFTGRAGAGRVRLEEGRGLVPSDRLRAARPGIRQIITDGG